MSTVSVTWFDKDAVWRAVEAHARALAVRFPEIEEIRVFGSLVKGTAVPGAFPCGVDVFPYTRAEVARMTSEGNTLVAVALVEGRIVFSRT